MDNTVTICLDIDVTCASYEIDWLSRKGVLIPCEKDNCVTIKLDPYADPGSQNRCIEGYIICLDSKDGICHEPIYFKKCLCDTNADCGECGDCNADGVCDSICSDEELEQGKICTSDGCQCPPDKPFLNGITGKCGECIEDTIHPDNPCLICKQGTWIQKICQSGTCVDGTCQECATGVDCAGNTDGRNCCNGGKCECCEGQYFNYVTRQCEDIPDCSKFGDCPDCYDCVEIDGQKKCVPIQCALGHVCIPGKGCVPECDCDDPIGCPEGKTCVQFDDNLCYCDVDPCAQYDCASGECAQIPGCKCDENGNCETDTDPCAKFPCGTSCADQPGCICEDGVNCITDPDPCAKLDCSNNECSNAHNCQCNGDDCESIVDPDTGSGCSSELTLTKGNCELRAKLTTNKCCPCNDYTGLVKLGNYIFQDKVTAFGTITRTTAEAVFHVDLRKGSASSAQSANNLPSVYDATNAQVLQNEIPISGQVEIRADYLYYEFDETGKFLGSVWQYDQLIGSQTLTVANGSKGVPVVRGNFETIGHFVRQLELKVRVSEDIKFKSGCVIEKGKVLGAYQYTSSILPAIATVDKSDTLLFATQSSWRSALLETEGCGTTEFKWYWAKYNSAGTTTGFEVNPFRKVFVSGSNGVFEDWINKPEKPSFANGFDNRGGLISGFGYKVVATCGCTGEETVIYEGCNNPGRVTFCDPESMEVSRVNCSRIRLSLTADCVVNRDLQFTGNESSIKSDGQVKYRVYFNGDRSKAIDTQVADVNDGVAWSNDLLPNSGNYKDPITKVEVLMNHDTCEECILVWEEDVDLVKPTYDEVCTSTNRVRLDFDITNTSVNTIKYNQKSYTDTDADSIIEIGNLLLGSTIDVTYVYNNGCEMTDTINVTDSCCDELEITVTQDSASCVTGEYDFSAEITPTVSGIFGWYDGTTKLGTGETFQILKSEIDEKGLTKLTVKFVPDDDCEELSQDINLDIATDDLIKVNEQDAKDGVVNLCGKPSYDLTYNVPDGLNGSIQYKIDGGPTLSAAWDGIAKKITIPVSAPSSGSTRTVELMNDGSLVGNTNSCITLEPKVYNFNYKDNTTLTAISTSVINVCEGEDIKVVLTGTNLTGATLTMSLVTGGSTITQSQVVQYNAGLNQHFINLTGLSTGTYQATASTITPVTAGCDGIITATQTLTFTVVAAPDITYVVSSCTPGATTSTFVATITKVNTTGGTLVATASDGSTLTVNQGTGEVSGTVQSGSTVTVTLVGAPGNCPDPQIQFNVDCNCPTIPDPVISDATYCTAINTLNLLVDNAVVDYDVIWTNPADASTTLNYTTAYTPTQNGTHKVQFIDDNGCVSNEVTFTVSQSASLDVNITGDETNLCIGEELALSLSISGGTGPYTYLWNHPNGTTTTDSTLVFILNNINQFGPYTVTVTDANGCTGTDTDTVTAGNQCDCDCTATFVNIDFVSCDFSIDLTSADCNNYHTITVRDSGDAVVYTDNFGNGNGDGYSTGTINATPGEIYTYTLQGDTCNDQTDTINMSCTDCSGVTIVPNETVTNETCGATPTNDGSIFLAPQGGTPPYTVSGDLNALNNTGLGADTYSITITDAAGCNVATNIVVGDDNTCCTDETCEYAVEARDTGTASTTTYTNGIETTSTPPGLPNYGIVYLADKYTTKTCSVTGVTDPVQSVANNFYAVSFILKIDTDDVINVNGSIDLISGNLPIPGSVTDSASLATFLNNNTTGVTWQSSGGNVQHYVLDDNTDGIDVTANAGAVMSVDLEGAEKLIYNYSTGCGTASITYNSIGLTPYQAAGVVGLDTTVGVDNDIDIAYNKITINNLPTLTRTVSAINNQTCNECN